MLHSVGVKTLHDQRRALIAWSLSLALLVAMYVALWPSLRNQPSMSDFLNQMPKAMRSLFAASGADMSTPGRLRAGRVAGLHGPPAPDHLQRDRRR